MPPTYRVRGGTYNVFPNTDRAGCDIGCYQNTNLSRITDMCNNNKNCKSFIYAEPLNNVGCIKNVGRGDTKCKQQFNGRVTLFEKA